MRDRLLISMLLLALPFMALRAQDVWIVEGDTIISDTTGADLTAVEAVGTPALPWPDNVCQRINEFLRSPIFRTSTVGIEVFDLTADSVIYAYNEHQRMRPASTMKLFTAITALEELGISHRFTTEVLYSGSVDSCVLRGDIYIKGGMDPLFDNADMDSLVQTLRVAGIDTVRGNVYSDLSLKEKKPYGEGWCWDDDNHLLTPLLLNGKGGFIRAFIHKLKNAGITLMGDTLKASVPADAHSLCTRSHTLGQILTPMMKHSYNLHAEAVFYHIAASTGRKWASSRDARGVVNRLMTEMGLDASQYYVADGSGLSLYNYVSPHATVAFLRYAYDNYDIYARLLPTLPVAGVDGTLEKRMRKGYAQYSVRAKTGTLEGISSLAGYCIAANKHYLCFSIINMGIRSTATAHAFQDRLCEALCAP